MPETTYLKLRKFLDQFPFGFPETPTGVEIKILKRLFTEEEAEIVLLLSPSPEEVKDIAVRGNLDIDELEQKLTSMSRRGLVFRISRKGKTLFSVAPFVIGLYEYSTGKMDEELARLYRAYYDIAYQEEMGASRIPHFKVIPVERTIAADTMLLPFHQISGDIRNARKIAVTDCACRKEAQLTGEGCDHPIETCLSFGVAAEYYIENGMGREINADEAIAILEEADEAGLVHAGVNSKHLSNICNCCPCCCLSMKGMTQKGRRKDLYMNALFEAKIDGDACVACENCLERCPVGAIEVEDIALVDRDKCLGCGLCAGDCPTEAITLHLRPDRQEPFDRVQDMGRAILEGKKQAK